MVTTEQMVRLRLALQDAGLDRWSASQPQDAPHLLTVYSSGRDDRVWLRPHFTAVPPQLELTIDRAVEAIERWVTIRLDRHRGAEPPAHASEDEALSCWDHLVAAAENVPVICPFCDAPVYTGCAVTCPTAWVHGHPLEVVS